MIDQDALGTAIKAKYDGSDGATLRGLLGSNKFAMDAIPEGTDFPHIVFYLVDDIPEDTFTEEVSGCRVSFNLFYDIRVTTAPGAIQKALKELFRHTDLTVEQYGHIGTKHLSLINLGIDDKNIAHCVMDFFMWWKRKVLSDATFEDLDGYEFEELDARDYESFEDSVWK